MRSSAHFASGSNRQLLSSSLPCSCFKFVSTHRKSLNSHIERTSNQCNVMQPCIVNMYQTSEFVSMQGFGFMRQGCLNSFDILFGSYTDSCTDVSLLTGEYLQLYLTTPPPGRWCAPTETVWGKHQTSSARVSPEAGGRPPRKKNFLSTLSQDQMRDIRG